MINNKKGDSQQSILLDSVLKRFDAMDQKVQDVMKQNVEIIDKGHDRFSKSLDNTGKTIGELQQKMVQLDEANKKIFELGKDISSLQDILKAPKLRGGFGELVLADILQQMLPRDNYKLQYSFNSGNMVDAAIFLGEKIVPVDSKFPLENFKKALSSDEDTEKQRLKKVFFSDVKKHIDSISNKYILPDEKTFDFALMYVPAENVYYEMIINDKGFEDSLSAYAMKKKVIAVSPNSFYAYLQAILLGLKGMTIESSARTIMENISKLQHEINKITDDYGIMGTHLKNLSNSYEKVDRNLQKFGLSVETITAKQEVDMLTEG
jgi:DNA recombination protein RmuC